MICDDLDLPSSAVRFRGKGGHGGHNGMRSITQHLSGSQTFPRVRIGTARLKPRINMSEKQYGLITPRGGSIQVLEGKFWWARI